MINFVTYTAKQRQGERDIAADLAAAIKPTGPCTWFRDDQGAKVLVCHGDEDGRLHHRGQALPRGYVKTFDMVVCCHGAAARKRLRWGKIVPWAGQTTQRVQHMANGLLLITFTERRGTIHVTGSLP